MYILKLNITVVYDIFVLNITYYIVYQQLLCVLSILYMT